MELSQALITGQGVTLSEALSTGLMVTGVGLAIVFGVLIILMIVLMLFKVIFNKDSDKTEKKNEKIEVAAAPAAVVEDEMSEAELIAVFTAAIAASLKTSTYNLQIKSYKRVDSKRPAWNKAGVHETINSRF